MSGKGPLRAVVGRSLARKLLHLECGHSIPTFDGAKRSVRHRCFVCVGLPPPPRWSRSERQRADRANPEPLNARQKYDRAIYALRIMQGRRTLAKTLPGDRRSYLLDALTLPKAKCAQGPREIGRPIPLLLWPGAPIPTITASFFVRALEVAS
jgi:hypothetical protein